ncbi:MAG: hypothetical protein R3305_02495 [Gammaproteobacteria bacterium]|nr:hypothetical protein [Gammaproteobacteria bacterium]
MTYDEVLAALHRCRRSGGTQPADYQDLVDAVEYLTLALKTDLTQIKVALSHNAALLEKKQA